MIRGISDDTQNTGSNDRWITGEQAREMLGVGRTKFQELRAAGELTEHKIGYRTVRFSQKDVLAYMQRRPRPKRNRG